MMKTTEAEISELRSQLNDMYTPLSEAKEEIWRRWNDKALREKVEGLLDGRVPDILESCPRAVLSRQVMSPNFESIHYLQRADEVGLEPVFFEYRHDTFVAKNIDKYYLCRLSFYDGDDRYDTKRENHVTKRKVIDFDKAEGRGLHELTTLWGDNLVDFHHEIAEQVDRKRFANRFDCSDWFNREGDSAKRYYVQYLSLFLCFGVLFENYLLDERQLGFTRDVIIPNFRKTSECFGFKPLIVHLGPDGEEEDLFWKYYPESVKGKIDLMSRRND